MIATSTKTPQMTAPTLAFSESWRHNRPRRSRGLGAGRRSASRGRPPSAGLPRAGTRVGEDVDRVGDEVRHEHSQCDDQEDALHERVVVGGDGVVEGEADARVGEDDLHEQRPRDDEAEREGEARQVRQDGVAGGVGHHDPPGASPFAWAART